jgi:hypothetical protein
VPSTRKISTSGGISTKVTCSARRDNSPILVARLINASASASSEATVSDMMKTSSPGDAMARPSQAFMMPSCMRDQAQPAPAQMTSSATSDLWPLAPLGSR